MKGQYPEIYILIIIGSVVALLLIGFIVAMVIMYKRRQYAHEQELLKSQIEIQEQTFRNISQEIHDNIGQLLSVIKLTLASAPIAKDDEAWEYLQESKQAVGEVIESISNLSKSLHPERILQIGITEAIHFELTKLAKTKVFTTSFTPAANPLSVSGKNEIFLFRIIQEILNNIVKHSEAKHISVDIANDGKYISFKIADNGKGFDVEKTLQRSHMERGIGLSSIINRTKLIGGTLTINSQPGQGTTTLIQLPADLHTQENNNTLS